MSTQDALDRFFSTLDSLDAWTRTSIKEASRRVVLSNPPTRAMDVVGALELISPCSGAWLTPRRGMGRLESSKRLFWNCWRSMSKETTMETLDLSPTTPLRLALRREHPAKLIGFIPDELAVIQEALNAGKSWEEVVSNDSLRLTLDLVMVNAAEAERRCHSCTFDPVPGALDRLVQTLRDLDPLVYLSILEATIDEGERPGGLDVPTAWVRLVRAIAVERELR